MRMEAHRMDRFLIHYPSINPHQDVTSEAKVVQQDHNSIFVCMYGHGHSIQPSK